MNTCKTCNKQIRAGWSRCRECRTGLFAMSVDSASRESGIPLSAAWRGIADKTLPATTVKLMAGGTAWRITKDQLQHWRDHAKSQTRRDGPAQPAGDVAGS